VGNREAVIETMTAYLKSLPEVFRDLLGLAPIRRFPELGPA
jgi:hypothetical protein